MDAVNMWSYTKRMLNMYPEYVFGTGNDVCGETMKGIWKNRKTNGISGFQAIKTGLKDGFYASEAHNKKMIAESGGFWKNLLKNIKGIGKDLPNAWKEGGSAAKIAGKSSFIGSFKGIGKSLAKKMPLIGSLSMLIFEAPNIFKATKDEGVVSGVAETAKTAVRLGTGALGAAIGTAILPIPLIGSLVGWMAGEAIGRLFVGKSYVEKKESQAAEIKEQITQATGQNVPFGAATGAQAPTTPTNATSPLNYQPTMSPQQIQQMAMQLYGGSNMSNDYMYNMNGMNKLNQLA